MLTAAGPTGAAGEERAMAQAGDVAMPVEARLASARAAPDDDLSWLPAWRIRELIAARSLSPVEVTEHFLRRIDALDPQLHAFRQVDHAGALAQAKAAEAAVTAGERLGPLHGVPVAVKELIAVRDMPYWEPFLGQRVIAERDSLEVARLRGAGAIILGVTIGGLTAYEFGESDRQPHNPWNRERVCGDSSSGSACAQTSGMVPITLVTDGLGSTRLPAAYCGQVGMLGARGRVPRSDWSQLTTSALSHSGPIARDVRDAATMMGVLAGWDGRDFYCIPEEAPDYLGGIDRGARGLRLVWTDDFGYAGAYATPETPRVIETVRRAAEGLRGLGAEIEETREDFGEAFAAGSRMMLGDPGLAIFRKLPREDVAFARETRGRLWETYRRILEGRDFIISATTPHVAPTRTEWAAGWTAPEEGKLPAHMAHYTPHTAAANVIGWPAISVPAGFVDGLPVGFQIIGRPDSEPRMIQLAQAFLAMRD
jgi:Asp-tRNA(Asn)/Glu-tRNA(Gln) amidotransferase A subunit family amidase